VTIPNSVTSIGNGAFSDCNSRLYDMTRIYGAKLVDGWLVDFGHAENLDLTSVRGFETGLFDNDNFSSKKIKVSSSVLRQWKPILRFFKDRIREIITMIFSILDKKKIRNKVKSIVLTGGTVKANATDYYINKITNLDTRKAITEFDLVKNGIEVKKYRDETYCCAYGLLMKAQERLLSRSADDYKDINKSKISRFFDYLIKLFIC
jgi:cell division ATPase FtsA